MATHGHKWKKTGKANIEKLPDTSGNPVVYSKDPDCAWEVMARTTDEPTLTPGAEMTVAAKTGIASDASAELLPGTKMDGVAGVWELTATLTTTDLTI
jgi:hypothetical protein